MQQSDQVTLGAKAIQDKKSAQLATFIQNGLSPNSFLPLFKFKALSRNNVPLLCIACACDSIECVKLLVKSGANLEDEDRV